VRILLSILFLFCCACSSLLYYPTRVRYVDPDKLKFRPEEIHFAGADEVDTVGWYFKAGAKPAPVTFLFFHGNGQNLSAHFASLYWLLEHGYDFLIFDYPGYGISEGQPTPANTVDTGRRALNWLRQKVPHSKFAIFGQSLGGAVALQTVIEETNRNDLCLVVVESTFPSYRRAGSDLMAQSAFTWPLQWLAYVVLSDRKAPRERVAEISPLPLIVMHATKDSIVRFSSGQKVYELAKEPKQFWEDPDGEHITAFVGSNRSIFRKRLLESLRTTCRAESVAGERTH
jgi:pimeloyl-ACP methyl ester carboxylesterase